MTKTKTAEALQASEAGKPVYVARWGRGRIGGTGALMLLGQRARASGRHVVFRDGDLKSSTLHAFYGEECSRPPSLDGADFSRWVLEDLDAMAEDRVSRLLDVSGGSSSVEDLLRDLELPEFCATSEIRLTWLCMLGPDVEDFEHVLTAVRSGHMKPEHMLLVLNEGAIRQGQNPVGAFDPLRSHVNNLVQHGAKAVYLTRLPVFETVRQNRLDFYDVAARKPGPDGSLPKATSAFIVQKWLRDFEAGLQGAGATSWVP